MGLGINIFIMVVLLAMSGFFSAAEIALVSLNRVKVNQLIAEKRAGAHFVKKLKDDPQRMLSTILVGNNLVNTAASVLATVVAFNMVGNYAVSIVTGVMTLLILIFGEITPKSLAAAHHVPFALFFAPFIWYLSLVLSPINYVLRHIVQLFMKLFGIEAKQALITEEEIRTMIHTAKEEGSIKAMEKEMLESIFEFDDIAVSEISTPRSEMIMIEANATIDDALGLVVKKKVSRIPVYEKNKDNIVGTIHVKDILPYVNNKQGSKSIKEIMKKPYFIPEVKKVSSLMRQFQKRKEHIAIVVDEYGSVTGLVTLEDVLEEIVGEIMDETDDLDINIQKISDKAWTVKGTTEIDEINQKLKMDIQKEGYDTFSGFIMKLTGRIPKQDEVISFERYKITIVEVANNRIEKAKIERQAKKRESKADKSKPKVEGQK